MYNFIKIARLLSSMLKSSLDINFMAIMKTNNSIKIEKAEGYSSKIEKLI